MSKPRKQTVGQAFVERIERMRAEAQLNNSVMDYSMADQERRSIEQLLGRKLRDGEIIAGKIENRTDDRTFAQALEDSYWKPVMPAQDEGDLFDAAIREAETAVRDRQLREMKPDERVLYLLKEDQLKQQKTKATAEEHKARLADPEVASRLTLLRELQVKSAYDPSWTVSDLIAVERAIEQLETPGADLEVGFQLHQAAMDVVAVKRQAVVDELRSQHGEAAVRLAELEEAIAAESGESGVGSSSLDSLQEAFSKAFDTFGAGTPPTNAAWDALQAANNKQPTVAME